MKYLDIGNKSADKTLVLLGGLGTRYDTFWKNQFELGDTYRIIVPSLIGHIGNETDKEITIQNMAKEIAQLLDILNVKQAYIGGLSLGGLVTIELHKQRPDLFNGMILANTTHMIPSYIGNKIVKDAEKLFYHNKNKLIDEIVNRSLHNKEYIDEAREAFYLTDKYLDAAKVGIGCNYMYTLMKVKCKVLIIGGLFDSTTPIYLSYALKMLIHRAKIKILHSGHLSNIECKDEFNKTAREFIG